MSQYYNNPSASIISPKAEEERDRHKTVEVFSSEIIREKRTCL